MATISTRPVAAALSKSAGLLIGVAIFSGVINLLALTGAMYMLQVYDRVIPSRSIPTLLALSVLLAVLFAANGFLDVFRARIMARIAVHVDEGLRGTVFAAVQTLALQARGEGDGLLAIRDLDRLRGFLAGGGPASFFDLPWIPVYLVIIFLLHPMLGWFAVLGAGLLIALTMLAEGLSRKPSRDSALSGSARLALASVSGRNADVAQAMGMRGTLQARWDRLSEQHLADQIKASDAVGGIGVVSKTLRLFLQSGILGVGAYLAVQGEVSAGVIIAGSIVMSRALAPIETVIQHWRGFVEARQAAGRLRALLLKVSAETKPATDLPLPSKTLRIEHLTLAHPGQKEPAIQDISLSLVAGDAIGIIGPSGSGKTTLAKAIIGVLQPVAGGGTVRLDGAALDQWPAATLGQALGYLPQDIQLFDGTVAENIARLSPSASDKAVIAAARAAEAHDMIVGLPDGYQTRIGEGGVGLSAGQRQRVALARALYGDPFLVVLDEPNSNLDSAGDAALSKAIKAVRARGGIVIVIAHRPSALLHVDKVLAMAGGKMQATGPKEEVLRKVLALVPTEKGTSATASPVAQAVGQIGSPTVAGQEGSSAVVDIRLDRRGDQA